MSYLSFITDENLLNCVKKLHLAYIECQKKTTTKKFYANKVDPIKFLFDMTFNNIDEENYIRSEIARQNDKTISNAIGEFHQSLLGCIDGIKDLGVGQGCDLVNDDETIFAEIKNKHNTMNSSSSEATIQKLISFADDNPNATCYLVQIIAKKSTNKLWKGTFNKKYYEHPRVRVISGDRFYALVTGIDNAFEQLCKVIPQVLNDYVASLDMAHHNEAELSSVYSELIEKSKKHQKSLIEQIMHDNFNTYNGFSK